MRPNTLTTLTSWALATGMLAGTLMVLPLAASAACPDEKKQKQPSLFCPGDDKDKGSKKPSFECPGDKDKGGGKAPSFR